MIKDTPNATIHYKQTKNPPTFFPTFLNQREKRKKKSKKMQKILKIDSRIKDEIKT